MYENRYWTQRGNDMTADWKKRVLVAGWFSFEHMGVTAGDVLVRDVLCNWLVEEEIEFDIASAPPLVGGVNWQKCMPQDYSAVIFTCGPLGNGPPVAEFFKHFRGCKLIGMNLSMLQSLEEWNPFALLIERDSDRTQRPDLALLGKSDPVPVVAEILVHHQKEYKDRARHHEAEKAISEIFERHNLARIRIDTALANNQGGLTNADQILSVLSRVDFTITTRLHGLVLSLRAGIPAIAIDPIAGGAKVSAQAKSLNWPLIYTPDQLDVDTLDRAVGFCRSAASSQLAQQQRDAAVAELTNIREDMLVGLRSAQDE